MYLCYRWLHASHLQGTTPFDGSLAVQTIPANFCWMQGKVVAKNLHGEELVEFVEGYMGSKNYRTEKRNKKMKNTSALIIHFDCRLHRLKNHHQDVGDIPFDRAMDDLDFNLRRGKQHQTIFMRGS